MPAPADKKSSAPAKDDERAAAAAVPLKDAAPQALAPPARPPLRSNFDLEPNPFEQSFSIGSDASSTSVATQATLKNDRASPRAGSPANAGASKAAIAGETPKPMLPPLASIASPSDTTYAWGLNSADLAGSLRSGPLSPAMLQGPQHANPTGAAHLAPAASGLSLGSFDHANFGRTGLTPSTGLTPLVGGPVSFPPPSPNTAAFLAMVTNSTTAAALASSTAATITPNTLSTITGVLNTTSMPQQFDQRPDSFQGFTTTARPEAYNASSSSDQQVNGLFLLSQAHQELAKREEAQRAGSVSGLSDATVSVAAGGAQSKRGAKRKSVDTSPTLVAGPTTRGKKTKTAPASKARKARRGADSDDDDDLDDDSDADASPAASGTAAVKGSKKPETEEEKRRNFLERNRQAALKCRQRKKQWLSQLQAKVEFLGQENERLQSALMASREEIQRLTALVGAGAMNIQQSGGGSMAQPPPVAVSQSAVVGGGTRGYGY